MTHTATNRRWTSAAATLTAGLLLASCQGTSGPTSTGPSAAAGTGALNLAADCPATVIAQTAWAPESEHGALYHLLGQNYTLDTNAKKVTGPLIAQGKDTGVKIEVRAGGPAVGFQSAGAQLYADPTIMIAQVSTDEAVDMSAKQPVLSVVAPFEIAPYMIMWDPATYPTFNTIADIGKTSTKVLYFSGAQYIDYFIASGILKQEQVDASYDGSPTRFLAEQGKVAQQGFATSEPYTYEQLLPQWKKPVKFQLVHEMGYPIYPQAIAIRADKKAEHTACLKKLVPIIQRSQIDYVKDPVATNDLIVKANEAYKGFAYTKEQAAFSVEQQLKLKIVSNGPNATLGDFEDERVKKIIDILTPVYAAKHKEIKAGLTAQDLVTNEFIDQSISLS
jgi:hypothetical protein